MSELTREEVIARGRRAQEMLSDPVLEECFEEAKKRFHAEWLDTTDPQKQMAAWAKTHALPAVAEILRRIAAEGEYASEVLRRAQ